MSARSFALLPTLLASACASSGPAPNTSEGTSAETRTSTWTTLDRYTVLTTGWKSGTATLSQGSDGAVRATFEFNDRGRGPKLVADVAFAPSGSPSRIEIRGNDY